MKVQSSFGPDFLKDGIIQEEIAGDFLFLQGKTFFGQVGIMDEIASSFLHLPFFKEICSANLFVEADIDYIFGMPYTMSIRGLSIDADRNICAVIGASDKIKEFMTISGYTSSTLEHNIWEKWYGEGAISAIKAIQIANESNIPIYDIDASNVSIVDGFNIPSLAKQDIKNAINAGMIAKCPSSNINYLGWQGTGYIITDPTTGEGRYEIVDMSGGIILNSNPSARPFRDYEKIEREAIEYAKTLTGQDDCANFANFAQFLANKFTDNEFRSGIFLAALYELSTSDDGFYHWYFGLIGNVIRSERPSWLNNHDDGNSGSGWKIFDPKDKYLRWPGDLGYTGRKDHFVTNAQIPFGTFLLIDIIHIIGQYSQKVREWKWIPYEESTNDMAYNREGQRFGLEISWPPYITSKDEVGQWIIQYLHE